MLPTTSAVLLFSCVSATVFGVSVIVSDGSDFIFLCVSDFIFFRYQCVRCDFLGYQ